MIKRLVLSTFLIFSSCMTMEKEWDHSDSSDGKKKKSELYYFDLKTGEISEEFKKKLQLIGIYAKQSSKFSKMTKLENLDIETVHEFLQENCAQCDHNFYLKGGQLDKNKPFNPTKQQAIEYLNYAFEGDYSLGMFVSNYSSEISFAAAKWMEEAEKVKTEYELYCKNTK